MTEPFHHEEMELPDDLRSLDAELSSIRYEMRPSFGPELRAELSRAWVEGPPAAPPSRVARLLIAAGLAALLVGTAAVPSARASFVRLIGLTPEPAAIEVAEPVVVAVLPSVAEEVAEPAPAPAPAEAETPAAPAVLEVEEPVSSEPVITRPELIDRIRSVELLQDAYPMWLQRRGVGGTVWLRVWIDETGLPGQATVLYESGYDELDRAALRTLPRFTFTPALRDGQPYGTWIQFPVDFEPDPELVDRELRPAVDPLSLPNVPQAEWWQMSEPLDPALLPADVPVMSPELLERAERELVSALPDPSVAERYGPVSAILAGEAPDGVSPAEWRPAVGSALSHAIELGSETPASLLAFGRIRLRQGLRTEARTHFERGLQMAVRSGTSVSPWVTAELHYERGRLVREHWRSSSRVGRVVASAFDGATCAQARTSGASGSGYASTERLIAWNYLCPEELGAVFGRGFEASDAGRTDGDLTLMMASFRAAIEAEPAHVGANTDFLVTLALQERWDDLLHGARRFAHVSGGHPNALLLAGLAHHRLENTERASELFELALDRVPVELAADLTDVGFLLDGGAARSYRDRSAAERRVYNDDFWAGRDRAVSTVVNERWVEHMARATIAHLRYGSVFGDAGEVWVRFGGPNTIHIVDDGGGRLTEFWDYGRGPDITFVRWVSSERTDLTPEGRAYVDDLGKIFPPQ